jgi:hypothetical protein
MRATRRWLVWVALGVSVAGCGGNGDERPELAAAEQATPPAETSVPEAAPSEASNPVFSQVRSIPLPPRQRHEVGKQAAHTAAAVRRWDVALGAENDILRGFWHGAAPLDLAWLDERQRPPSRFDLETAVDLVRPVPGHIRDAATVCAP